MSPYAVRICWNGFWRNIFPHSMWTARNASHEKFANSPNGRESSWRNQIKSERKKQIKRWLCYLAQMDSDRSRCNNLTTPKTHELWPIRYHCNATFDPNTFHKENKVRTCTWKYVRALLYVRHLYVLVFFVNLFLWVFKNQFIPLKFQWKYRVYRKYLNKQWKMSTSACLICIFDLFRL